MLRPHERGLRPRGLPDQDRLSRRAMQDRLETKVQTLKDKTGRDLRT